MGMMVEFVGRMIYVAGGAGGILAGALYAVQMKNVARCLVSTSELH